MSYCRRLPRPGDRRCRAWLDSGHTRRERPDFRSELIEQVAIGSDAIGNFTSKLLMTLWFYHRMLPLWGELCAGTLIINWSRIQSLRSRLQQVEGILARLSLARLRLLMGTDRTGLLAPGARLLMLAPRPASTFAVIERECLAAMCWDASQRSHASCS